MCFANVKITDADFSCNGEFDAIDDVFKSNANNTRALGMQLTFILKK